MLLINSTVDSTTQLLFVKSFTYASFPTSIGYLAGYMRDIKKVNIAVYDEQLALLTHDDLKKKLKSIDDVKIVGISCLTGTSKRVYELTHLIKKFDPNFFVVLGGIHPTAVPEECLKKSAADIVVRGEGEETLGEIYDFVKNKGDLKEIKGIVFKHKNNFIYNPERGLVKNLEDFPPFPYDLFANNIEKYKDFGTIVGSRGCPFKCIFCSQRLISGQLYRYLPDYRIINKIKLLVDKYHQDKIWFIDDTFTVNKQRAIRLLGEIIKSGYHKKVCFIAQSRGKDITWELLTKMKEANFASISFGVETGSEKVMSQIDKAETVEDNVRAIKLTHKAGISTDASFVMGLPTETKEDRKLSSKLARSIPLDGARFNIAIPYPGTRLYEIAKKEKRLNVLEDWSNCSNQHYMISDNIPYAPVGTSNIELIYDTLVANLLFTLRPKILFKILFTSALSGAGVLSLPSKWYFSPKVLFSLSRFFIFIMKRYLVILFKGAFSNIFKNNK